MASADTMPNYEKPIDNNSPPILMEHNTKQVVSIATDDTMERHDISGSSTSASLERWNEPRINMYRYFTTLYSFIIMGMNDAATGVSIH
jgi:hypothetical protein